MLSTKVVMIGAGSYVFSIGLLYDLIVEGNAPKLNIVLVDTNEEVAELVAEVGKIMVRDAGVSVDIDFTSDRVKALRNADFVLCSAAVQLQRRYQIDLDVISRHGIQEITSECGGLGGLSYALRSIGLVLEIAKDMERYCPNAWLFDVTNPLPRVVTAVTRHSSIKAAGFCNVAHGGMNGRYENVGRIVNRDPSELDVVSAGLNHFSWLLSVRDKNTGDDLMPKVRRELENGTIYGGLLTMKLWQKTGYLPLAGDAHTGEYVPFQSEFNHGEKSGYHGDPQEREKRLELMRSIIASTKSWKDLLVGRAWERPGLVVRALVSKMPHHLDMVNIPNLGYIDNLPYGAVVEIPADVQSGTIVGRQIGSLPAEIAELCRHVSRVHTMVADAAATGDRALLEEVIQIDPAITEKEAARFALQELLAVHREVLPQFA